MPSPKGGNGDGKAKTRRRSGKEGSHLVPASACTHIYNKTFPLGLHLFLQSIFISSAKDNEHPWKPAG